MKNSNEWLFDIECKLEERYKKRSKRRKAIVCIGSCSVIMITALVLLNNKPYSSSENSILIENSEQLMTTTKESESVFSEIPGATSVETKNTVISTSNSEETKVTGISDSSSTNTEITIVYGSINDNKSSQEESHTENPVTNIITEFQESHTENSVTNTITESYSEKPASSALPDSPFSKPDNIIQLGFKINRISNQISAAPRSYSSETYDTLIWSYDQITGYYGVDYRNALNEMGFNTDEYNEYRIITDKSGNMADDKINFLYINSEGSSVKLSASKVLLPYDSVYELESKETTNIQGTDVLIGGFPAASDPDSYILFYADFEKNNIHYRLTGNNISGQQFYETIEKIISK